MLVKLIKDKQVDIINYLNNLEIELKKDEINNSKDKVTLNEINNALLQKNQS